MNFSRFFLATFASAAVFSVANTAQAQYGQGGNFGQQGGGGSGSFGGGGGTGMSSSSGAFGQRTMGGGASVGASQGQGFGGNAMGSGFGQGQGTGFNNLQSVGVGTGAGGFSPQSFVGGDPSMMGTFVGGAIQGANGQRTGMNGMNGMNGLNGLNGQMGFGQNRNNRQNQQQRQNLGGGQNNARGTTSTRSVRTSYVIDFSHPEITTSKVATKLTTELSKSRALSAIGPIDVQMEGRTAILRGVVATDYDRSLAERLALLEPGVAQIQNELEVRSSRPLTPAEQRARSGSPGPAMSTPPQRVQ
jgi:osmotically-inducible protein OsmY